MIRVLFVCLGNICRSPMAEAVFAHLVREEGLSHEIATDSAGTGHWHLGEPPHMGTRHVLQVNNIRYDHRSRLITKADLNDFDYVITMDNENLADVMAMGQGTATIKPLMAYAPDAEYTEVPDPYYTGSFDVVFDLVHQGCKQLLLAIRKEHHL